MRVGIITISDRSSEGLREDASGKLLAELVKEIPAEAAGNRVVPDEVNHIQAAIISFADVLLCDVILTTGGTGIGPRDVTPEATAGVMDKEIPGISEALRREGVRYNPHSLLSRGIAGVRKKSLIVNLPGSPEAVKEAFEVLRPVLFHAVKLVRGAVMDCQFEKMR